MSQLKDRLRRYHEGVRRILLDYWDPIGVHGVPEAQDEYDSYVPGIYGRLLHHVPDDELFRHLWDIETQDMRLHADRERTIRVVQLLTRLRDEIERAS